MSAIHKKDLVEMTSGAECPICLADINPPMRALGHITGAQTDHCFHEKCLRNWEKSSGKLTCPVCRIDLQDSMSPFFTGVRIGLTFMAASVASSSTLYLLGHDNRPDLFGALLGYFHFGFFFLSKKLF